MFFKKKPCEEGQCDLKFVGYNDEGESESIYICSKCGKYEYRESLVIKKCSQQ